MLCNDTGMVSRPYVDQDHGLQFTERPCPHCRPVVEIPAWVIMVLVAAVFVLYHLRAIVESQ